MQQKRTHIIHISFKGLEKTIYSDFTRKMTIELLDYFIDALKQKEKSITFKRY